MNLLKGTFLRHKLFSTKSTSSSMWVLKSPPFSSWGLNITTWKVSRYGVFSGAYFPAFGLNMERYFYTQCILLCVNSNSWVTCQTCRREVFQNPDMVSTVKSFQKRNSIINHNDRSQNLPIEMSCFVCFTNQNSFFVDRIEYEKLRHQSTFLMMEGFQFQMGHNIQEWTK